jgi:FkbM family methyltransferase
MKLTDRLAHAVAKRYRALRTPRRGADVCTDLATLLTPRIIFDVGANVGQSAAKFRRRFAGADIHCFEPSAQSVARIQARRLKRVQVHQIALGSAIATARLAEGHDPAIFHLSDEGGAEVAVETLDSFCSKLGITRIDFLKIDTEGHDLEVLKGAAAMLSAGQIAAVQVEAGLNPDNKFHVPFELLKAYLEGHDYRLFGIYDQVSEWPTKEPHLRRANPMFVSPELYARYGRG